jgi:SHS2 domain-containing protein
MHAGRQRAAHRFVEHTGEVELQLQAPTLPALFAEAGLALAELLAATPPGATSAAERVVVRAPDREALLAEWLNELIYRGDVHKRVYVAFDIERLEDGELVATVRGGEPTQLRTAVKAATLHRLSIQESAGGVRATLVLDV